MSLSLIQVVLVFLCGAAGLYAWHAIGLKQKALRSVNHYCNRQNLQLLDQSLVLSRIRPRLSNKGIELLHLYRFEFSSTGDRRHKGTIELLGSRILHIHLDPYPVMS